MNILLCVKIEPDLGMLSETDWQVDTQGQIATHYARRQLNSFDHSTVSLALVLRESAPAHPLTVVTVGDQHTVPVLKNILALNVDRVVRIAPPEKADLRFNPHAVAQILAAFHHSQQGPAVIILGEQSGEGQNRQTGPLLAEMLGYPCVTQVTEISEVQEGLLRVTRQTAGYLQQLTLRPPVVLVTGNAAEAGLPVPTLKQKLAAAAKAFDVVTVEQLGVPIAALHPSVQNLSLTRLLTKRAGDIIAGNSTSEKVQYLCQQFLQRMLP